MANLRPTAEVYVGAYDRSSKSKIAPPVARTPRGLPGGAELGPSASGSAGIGGAARGIGGIVPSSARAGRRAASPVTSPARSACRSMTRPGTPASAMALLAARSRLGPVASAQNPSRVGPAPDQQDI